MNPRRLTSLIFAATASSAFSGTVYWDNNGTAANTGTTAGGTWGTDSFWNSESSGTGGSANAWVDGDTAVFSSGDNFTGAYSVGVTGTQTVGGITFKNGAVTLNGSGIISMNSGTIITSNSGITGTIGAVLSGSNGFTKAGTGTLILSNAANTYSGTTTVNQGALIFAKTAALYGGTPANWTSANLTANSGATLGFRVGGSGEFTNADITNTLLPNLTTGLNNNGLKAGSSIGFDTTNATIANGNANDTFTISNNIVNTTGTGSGTLGVHKLGTNTLVLSGTNSYTGVTTVSGGTLTVSGNQTAANGGWSINGTSTVNFNSNIVLGTDKTISFANGGSNNQRILNVSAGVTTSTTSTTWVLGGNTVNLNSGASWTQNGNLRFEPNSTFTDAVMNVNSGASFTYAGGTRIILTNSISTNGGDSFLNLSGGTFSTVQGFDHNGTGTAGTANLVFSNGGTLKLSASVDQLFIGTSSQPFYVRVGTGGGVIETVGSSTSTAIDKVISNVTGQTGSLTKTGAGTLTLATGVTHTYTGDTTVSAGKLVVNGNISTSLLTTVQTGASLGGSGSVGALTVDVNGTLTPGNSPGNLTVNGDLTLAGTYVWELAALATSGAGINFDTITLTSGNADLTGSLLSLSLGSFAPSADAFWQTNRTWAGILNNTGGGTLTGMFGGIDNSAWSSLGTFSTVADGNDVNLVWTAVPEPGAVFLGSLGALALLRRRRH